jgi:hypothetical protein
MTGSIFEQISFGARLAYCLEDKLVPDQEGKLIPEYKGRAEILYYNQCYGDKEELIRQFNEVAGRNKNISKPVFHIVWGSAPDEKLSKSTWVEISRDCARVLEFDQHQYVSILHKDTPNQHIHMVVNKLGFDGHVARGEFSFRKLHVLSHELENRYNLKLTFNQADRLAYAEKQFARKDKKLDILKEALRKTLTTACDLSEFEKEISSLGIKICKNEKGIAFIQDRHVCHRGSEAGYPWKKIEAILQENEKQKQEKQLRQHLKPNDDSEEPRIRYRISHHL